MNRFTNRLVRDLAWVIASPPLVSGSFNNTLWWNHAKCLIEFEDCLPMLLELDINPTPLDEYLNRFKTARLGLRFESFVAFWLNISPNYELLTKNLQIIEELEKGSHTHGEIDFIIKDLNTNRIIHLEVAVKFYLGTAPFDNPFRWFGINTRDQFGKKVTHLKQHQTQLSCKFSKYLKEKGYVIDEQQCLLKGRLFYPIGKDEPPSGAAKNHLRGRWVQSPHEFKNESLYPLDKKDWLSVLSKEDLIKLDCQSNLLNSEKTQCYVRSISHKLGDKELERVFYLPKKFRFPVQNTDK